MSGSVWPSFMAWMKGGHHSGHIRWSDRARHNLHSLHKPWKDDVALLCETQTELGVKESRLILYYVQYSCKPRCPLQLCIAIHVLHRYIVQTEDFAIFTSSVDNWCFKLRLHSCICLYKGSLAETKPVIRTNKQKNKWSPNAKLMPKRLNLNVHVEAQAQEQHPRHLKI